MTWLAHLIWFVPITAAIAVVTAALKYDALPDIKRYALRSFISTTAGIAVFALVVEAVTGLVF